MPKRRPGLPKVRTGCYTCKFRRVKCGEEKPFCHRCIVFDVICEGYSEPEIEGKTVSRLRQLVPKVAQPNVGTASLQLYRNPSQGTIMTAEEHRYFYFFCNDVAKGIGAPYHASIWERMIPQTGEIEPFLRHATVALGALKKSKAAIYQNPIFPQDSDLLDYHHAFAVEAYCKALKGIRESMTQNRGNVRSALLASLLAFCFESLEGHQKAATSHAIGGLTLFHRWQDEHHVSDPMETEDLTFAFLGLELQVLVFFNNRPFNVQKDHMVHLNNAISQMPPEFTNLKECHHYLQLITCRNLHFTALVQEKRHKHETTETNLVELPKIVNLKDKDCWRHIYNSDQIPSDLVADQQRYIRDITKWRRACTSVFNTTGAIPTNSAMDRRPEDFVIRNTLIVQSISSTLRLLKSFSLSESENDSHLSDYRTITELCAEVYPSLANSYSTDFLVHMGILPALGLVVMNCRDRDVRFQALGILLSCPDYQEGIWNSLVAGKLTGVIVLLEEPWRTADGRIPENRRASMLNLDVAFKEKRMTAAIRQRIGTDNVNDVEETTHIVTW